MCKTTIPSSGADVRTDKNDQHKTQKTHFVFISYFPFWDDGGAAGAGF
jgi:hypothetical protein